MAKISFYLGEEKIKELDALAIKNYRNLQEEMRLAIDNHLNHIKMGEKRMRKNFEGKGRGITPEKEG